MFQQTLFLRLLLDPLIDFLSAADGAEANGEKNEECETASATAERHQTSKTVWVRYAFRKASIWCFMVIFCLRGETSKFELHAPKGNDGNLTLTLKNLSININRRFELHCTCKPYESRCRFQVALVNSWSHGFLRTGYSWNFQTCGNTSASHCVP